jgi:hypothetical protein
MFSFGLRLAYGLFGYIARVYNHMVRDCQIETASSHDFRQKMLETS